MAGEPQGARISTAQQRAAQLAIVTEDPQARRPRFHAPRASIAHAEARAPGPPAPARARRRHACA